MIKIVGCNNHLGVGEVGLKENLKKLQELNPTLSMIEVVEEGQKDLTNPRLKNFDGVLKTSQKLSKIVDEVLQQDGFVVNILGDHAAAMGTVSASSHHATELGLIWIDAHSDINTPETTLSGNIHGMPIAALLNMTKTALDDILYPGQKIKPENIVMIGLRDVDPGEQKHLEELKIRYYSYQTVVEKGLKVCLDEIVAFFKKVDKLHVSLDLDSMDPTLIPGVSVPVEKGFTPLETKEIVRTLLRECPVSTIDIVELNPLYDKDDVSAKYVLELLTEIENEKSNL